MDSQLGTRFRIFFPVAQPRTDEPALPAPSQAPLQQPPVASAPADSGALTILRGDDEVALRLAVAEYLRSVGHHVLESQSALDALELARHHSVPIDILPTDIVMPELRGPELARQIQDLQPNIHVIYMSGYAEKRHGSRDSARSGFPAKTISFCNSRGTA